MCKECNTTINADVNDAINISKVKNALSVVLLDTPTVLRSMDNSSWLELEAIISMTSSSQRLEIAKYDFETDMKGMHYLCNNPTKWCV